ncbi:MAG: 5-(carboxyamino)imidazole ribonucleotide synthase [Gemmobacter sp.]
MAERLPTGAVIGILGGGQLGRMLAMAAARLGLRAHIYDPDPAAPARDVAAAATCAGWADGAALARFAAAVDVVTYEFENIPLEVIDTLAPLRPVHPGRRALATAQERVAEKSFLNAAGLATAPWAAVGSAADLAEALGRIGTPAILKTARMGYDGKGQIRITDPAEAPRALAAIGGGPAILEGVVAFSAEVSVIAARSASGEVAAYDPGENLHEGGILRRTTVPAPSLPARHRSDAVLIAARILGALDYVGVLGVELFVTPGGLLVNEIAPRVHNSGHWTQNGCAVDQFEQHIRAIAGWPLGDGSRHSDVVMENLIGADMARVPDLAATPGVALHLYGKAEVRAGRKMGHANRIRPRA